MFDDFKQHLKIPDHVLTKTRTEQKLPLLLIVKKNI